MNPKTPVRLKMNSAILKMVMLLSSEVHRLGMNELSYLTDLLEGRRFQKPCMIFCSRAVHNGASHIGFLIN